MQPLSWSVSGLNNNDGKEDIKCQDSMVPAREDSGQ
jgi:hypothetical protein